MTDSEYATLFFRLGVCATLLRALRSASSSPRQQARTARLNGHSAGPFKEWDCSTEEQQLLPGDVLALNTNGITESFNDAGEEFGGKRLIEVLLRHREPPPEALLAAIVEELSRFSPNERHDDITLIIARCKS